MITRIPTGAAMWSSHRLSASRRCRNSQVTPQHLFRGVRPIDRRHHQHVHEVRHERAARHRFLSVPQRRDDRRPTRSAGRPSVSASNSEALRAVRSRRTARSSSSRPSSSATRSRSRSSYTALDSQNLRDTAAAQALLGAAPEGDSQALSQSESVIARIDQRAGESPLAHGTIRLRPQQSHR